MVPRIQICLLLLFLTRYAHTFSVNVAHRSMSNDKVQCSKHQRAFLDHRLFVLAVDGDTDNEISTRGKENEEIVALCETGRLQEATSLLDHYEAAMREGDSRIQLNATAYSTVMHALATTRSESNSRLPEELERLLARMKWLAPQFPNVSPNTRAYNAVLLAWSKSFRSNAGKRCRELLTELWSLYNQTGNPTLAPIQSSYISTLTAIARSGGGRDAAMEAEEVLEEMERIRKNNASAYDVSPNTLAVNIVLHAWSKSGAKSEARQRCERILQRMMELYGQGRTELMPNTTSFNTVMDALANSEERGCEKRAEALLETMEDLCYKNEEFRKYSQPDHMSFNTVLNCWARSRDRTAARRADAILRHMEGRYAKGRTNVQPDVTTYNTVLTAWARSKDPDAADRAEQLLMRMDKAYKKGNSMARPNAVSHNIIINVLAKSKDPKAHDRAMDVLRRMKQLSEQGREDCRPDVFTYTSLIDALAKRSDKETAQRAIALLEELEQLYSETRDPALKPNIRTYTSVIHAIARSRCDPKQAEVIVNRLEAAARNGDSNLRPDIVCYDALINAYGWSNEPGKSTKCYEIFQHMLRQYETGENMDAKPDIITCNSVLNSCAYDVAETEEDHASIMSLAVETMEFFQTNAPRFGWPNHISYGNVLMVIDKHVKEEGTRLRLAEATFWQCCEAGHVSVLVVSQLHRVLPWERFSDLLGNALLSDAEEEGLRFDWRALPQRWTRYAPSPKERRHSIPSRRRPHSMENSDSATMMATRRRE